MKGVWSAKKIASLNFFELSSAVGDVPCAVGGGSKTAKKRRLLEEGIRSKKADYAIERHSFFIGLNLC